MYYVCVFYCVCVIVCLNSIGLKKNFCWPIVVIIVIYLLLLLVSIRAADSMTITVKGSIVNNVLTCVVRLTDINWMRFWCLFIPRMLFSQKL